MKTLWRNARIASFHGDEPYGWIERGAMVTDGAQIFWVGDASRMPNALVASIASHIDLGGACVTPGLIDCHTHLVYAGNRAREFELRLQGASYEQIAQAGGGIRSTVAATREAPENILLLLALERARQLMCEGVTTIEVKSGYGLTEHDETRLLSVARRIDKHLPLTVRTTFLGAHAVPPEFEGRTDDYVSAVCEWLPRLHAQNLVDAVDVFCERIGFSNVQTRRIFEVAKALNLPVKLHAEQLSDQDGAALAAEFGALSCDHLEYLSESGVAAMKAAGTVAVLLPGAYYFLRETKLPPIAALRAAGVPVALATDHNPGSSPTLSPLLVMNMACTLFGMTPEEAWRGFTVNAARALALQATHGALREGARADFAVWDVDHPRDLVYPFGGQNRLKKLIRGGVVIEISPTSRPGNTQNAGPTTTTLTRDQALRALLR